jgi:hypothetical protein
MGLLAYIRSAKTEWQLRARSLARSGSRVAHRYCHILPSAETSAATTDYILARPPQQTFD